MIEAVLLVLGFCAQKSVAIRRLLLERPEWSSGKEPDEGRIYHSNRRSIDSVFGT